MSDTNISTRPGASTYRNCTWGNLKIFGGIALIRFLFSFTTIRELERLSRQPASRVVILLLLRFLGGEKKRILELRKNSTKHGTYDSDSLTYTKPKDFLQGCQVPSVGDFSSSITTQLVFPKEQLANDSHSPPPPNSLKKTGVTKTKSS